MMRKYAIIALVGSLTGVAAYNSKDGMALAQLEQAVKCGEQRFKQWNVGKQIYTVDKSKLRWVEDQTTQFAAGVGRMTSPDGCFVALQGTEGFIQGMVDGVFFTKQFQRNSCKNCWLHHGFYDLYESIKGRMFNALQEFGCQSKPLYITGHSLGAAIGTIFLYDVLDANYAVALMMAMESPRPGDTAFANALQAKIISSKTDAVRITHYQDIVPHLPPAGLVNYAHALREIYYPARQGTHYQDCGMDDDSWNCGNQWAFHQWSWGSDHCWYEDINPCICSASGEILVAGNMSLVVV